MALRSPADGPAPKRGRPRREIHPAAVADAVAELFAEGGADAVSIIDAAEKLNVSRATLYRAIPTKEHLLGVLFERSWHELTEQAKAVLARTDDPPEQLRQLVALQIDAAVRMRRYMPVFFGGGDLPSDVFSRWHTFSRDFENLWVGVVAEAMHVGYLAEDDPLITARLLLGQCIWISRWYRPGGAYDTASITRAAINLLPALPAATGGTTNATRSGRRQPQP